MKKVATLTILLAFALLVTPCYAVKPATRVPSGLEVYDANGQFVGILVDITTVYEIVVFIPSMGKFVQLSLSGLELGGAAILRNLHYSTVDCVGQPYGSSNFNNEYWIVSFQEYGGTVRFFTMGPQQEILLPSYRDTDYPNCVNGGSGEPRDAYPLTEVALPFAFPLAVPLSFK